jgi:hypothetical protein
VRGEVRAFAAPVLDDLLRRRDDFGGDVEKFKKLVIDLDKFCASVEKKIAEIRAEQALKGCPSAARLKIADEELLAATAERAGLAAALAAQDAQGVDGAALAAQRARLEEALAQAVARKEAATVGVVGILGFTL